ncbi:MAG: MATE family efflux transporter [Pseudomonadales bacterium]|nr:MATE family efflux transporter [Pseudomonadales bacterium]
MNSRHNLLDGEIPGTLTRMTTPMILGMLMMFSFNLVDTFFISMMGTEPLSAISFTFPVTFTLLSLAIGLSIGTSAVVAKHLGRGDLIKARQASSVTSYVSMGLALLLAVLGYWFMDGIFLLLGAAPELLPQIREYMTIWLLTSTLLVGIISANSVLRASGDTRTPSFIMAGAGFINAALDPLLIFGLGPIPAMGIKGAAIATAISWIIGFIYLFYVLAFQHKLIDRKLPNLNIFLSSAREMLRIGIPASGANMLTPVAAGVMTAIAASYGEATVAAFGVGSRLESIASLLVLALSTTLPPFISQNFGAGKLDRVLQSFRIAIRFVLFWQLAVYLLMVVCANLIAGIFSSDPEVISAIRLFIWILPLGYGLQGVVILTNSALNALHKPMHALYLSIARFFVFYVPLAWLGSLVFGLNGFFAGAVLGNLLMAAIAWQSFNKLFSGDLKGFETSS